MQSHTICSQAVRSLAVDQIESANSGHPGVALGFADVVTVLWRYHMRFDPNNPEWINRDRFIFSNGHASALYYAVLHMSGFPLGLEDLKDFRCLDSHTPGHPERDARLGVDMTTGPLGQGFANGIGVAMAQHYLAHRFNQKDVSLFDYRTYVMVGDGCLMEGVSHEAASMAGCLGLSGLIVCWDDNRISIDGSTENWMQEDTPARFRAYGWHVIQGIDGHNPDAIHEALLQAQVVEGKPVLLCFKTKIGLDTDWENDCRSHGQPLGAERVKSLKLMWGVDNVPFSIPDKARAGWHVRPPKQSFLDWEKNLQVYQSRYANNWHQYQSMQYPNQATVDHVLIEAFSQLDTDKPIATRKASELCLSVLMDLNLGMIGGSADLTGSTGLVKRDQDVWHPKERPGSFIHFGVREFSMFAIANGLASIPGLRPYVSTFLVFSDYGVNAVRMAAMMRLPVVFIFTHDSIMVGEDGPTHQPIEHLDHLRAIPGLSVWRPANTFETFGAWREIIGDTSGPHCLVLTRQSVLQDKRKNLTFPEVASGGYKVYVPSVEPKGVILSTGSEVSLAIELASVLEKEGLPLQVVSVACALRFDQMDAEEKQKLLLNSRTFRYAIEASSGMYWHRYIQDPHAVFHINRFGASGSGKALYERYGFSVSHLREHVCRCYARYEKCWINGEAVE